MQLFAVAPVAPGRVLRILCNPLQHEIDHMIFVAGTGESREKRRESGLSLGTAHVRYLLRDLRLAF